MMDPLWILSIAIIICVIYVIAYCSWCPRKRATGDIEEGKTRTNYSRALSTRLIDPFHNRHVLAPDIMPKSLNDWNVLMQHRGLSDRNCNTFIVDSNYSDTVFTELTCGGNNKNNRPLKVVHLKKNKSTLRYWVAFRGQATLVVKLDYKMRPVHLFQYYK